LIVTPGATSSSIRSSTFLSVATDVALHVEVQASAEGTQMGHEFVGVVAREALKGKPTGTSRLSPRMVVSR
jgi:hypothetical protein